MERHNREGVAYEAEYRFRHRDGRWVWVHDEAVMILDEEGAPRLSQGVIFDITPLKHHEEQLRETEERFRGIVEHVPSGDLPRPGGRPDGVALRQPADRTDRRRHAGGVARATPTCGSN